MSSDSIKISSILPGDKPRMEAWKKLRLETQEYDIFNEGPIDGDQTINLENARVVLIRLEKDGVPVYFAADGNHRLAYLYWRYGPNVRITNYQIRDISISTKAAEVALKSGELPTSFEEFVSSAEEQLKELRLETQLPPVN